MEPFVNTAIIISIGALITSIYTIIKSDRTSKTSCKPYLNILYTYSDNDTSIILRNVGMGSAIITNIKFIKSEKNKSATSTSLVSLLSINKNEFSEYKDFPQDEYGIYIAETLVLCKISKNNPQIHYTKTVEQLKEDLKNISVKIEFKDIFNRKQKDMNMDFSYLKDLL